MLLKQLNRSKCLAADTFFSTSVQFQDETRSNIKNIERQIGQISRAVSKLEARDLEKLPSQIDSNRIIVLWLLEVE